MANQDSPIPRRQRKRDRFRITNPLRSHSASPTPSTPASPMKMGENTASVIGLVNSPLFPSAGLSATVSPPAAPSLMDRLFRRPQAVSWSSNFSQDAGSSASVMHTAPMSALSNSATPSPQVLGITPPGITPPTVNAPPGAAGTKNTSILASGPDLDKRREDLELTVKDLSNAQAEAKEKQWKYKNRDGVEVVVSERIGRILKSVNEYAAIVDVAIQYNPEATAFVWAGIRLILKVGGSNLCGILLIY